MSISIPTSASVSVTWKPGQESGDPSRMGLIQQGKALSEKADKVKDFFVRSDNSDWNDAHDGVGKVIVPIDDKGYLLEPAADRIKGRFSADDDTFTAFAWNENSTYLGQSKMVFQGGNVFHDRPEYLNSTSESFMESLTANSDGTLTYTRATA